MSKVLATENAPAAIGPYVQGVDLGSMIITSGQIPVNPKTGEVRMHPETRNAKFKPSKVFKEKLKIAYHTRISYPELKK